MHIILSENPFHSRSHLRGLKCFYWRQIFRRDYDVAKTQKLFSSHGMRI